MEKNRGFEVVTKYLDNHIVLPQRATKKSAGYDFAAAENITIPSIWKIAMSATNKESKSKETKDILPSTLVPTGIKAYMLENEYLMLVNRSSNPLKNNLSLPNGIGIIDADYYNNENNEGEIFVQLINYGLEDYTIIKGDRIAQGIFTPYDTIDGEGELLNNRTGGFGSSGKD